MIRTTASSRRRPALLFVVAPWLALATACAGGDVKIGSLYERLGGESGIGRIVDDFVATAQRDARIEKRFEKADLTRFRHAFGTQLCEITGGPCRYDGPDMAAAHRGMKISAIEFDAFIGDFAKSLDEHDVAPAEQRELLFALKAMQAEVMGLDD